MDQDRLKHSYAVGVKMKQIGEELGLSPQEREDLFLLGYVHDIGYEYSPNGVSHNKIGGEILKRNSYPYWREVYYHGEVDSPYQSTYLSILNYADMQVDKYGNDVGFEQRLEDIKSRYGEDSEVFQKCRRLIHKVQKDFQ